LEGEIRQGNSYYEDIHDSVGKFDFVMANPPFNVDRINKELLKDDKARFPFGMPRSDNGNYIWIQKFYSAKEGIVSLETMIRGTCEPAKLLDLVENFLLFSESVGGLLKLVAKNHQYLGVNRAIAAVQRLMVEDMLRTPTPDPSPQGGGEEEEKQDIDLRDPSTMPSPQPSPKGRGGKAEDMQGRTSDTQSARTTARQYRGGYHWTLDFGLRLRPGRYCSRF